MLKPGAKLPAFSLKDQNGNTFTHKSLNGQRVVLYFYPKDDTPGCTKEACNFRDNLPKFNKLGIPVYGISADDEKAHGKFIQKYDLNFSLLADTDHSLCEAFGTWVEKNMYGKKYFGIQRSTFLVSADGKIEKVWEKVSPDHHAYEILDYLRGGSASSETIAQPEPKATPKAKASVADKKTPAKKVVAKKAASKTVSKKTATTKATVKKAPAKKVATKKAPARKK